MINILIDTNIYRKKPKLDSPEFQAISYLAKKGELKIHVPYIVENEFCSHLDIEQEKLAQKVSSYLEKLTKNMRQGEYKTNLKKASDYLKKNHSNIVKERRNYFLNWLDENQAIRYDLTEEDSKKAFEAYFKGSHPFKEPKIRKDIPDSFIYQTIKKIIPKYAESLYLVIEDGKLSDACRMLTDNTFKNLAEFIGLDDVQALLREKVIDENMEQISQIITAGLEEKKLVVLDAIESELLSDEYSSIPLNDIPWENINITGVNKPYDIEFKGEVEYYGNGLFTMFFDAEVELLNEIHMNIHDAFDLDQDTCHVEIINDSVANVEKQNKFNITGTLEIKYELDMRENLSKGDVLMLLVDPEYTVEELYFFEIID